MSKLRQEIRRMILQEMGKKHPVSKVSAKSVIPSLLDLFEDIDDPADDPLAVVGSELGGAFTGGEPLPTDVPVPGQTLLDPAVIKNLEANVTKDWQDIATGVGVDVIDPEAVSRRAGDLGQLMAVIDSILSPSGGAGQPTEEDMSSMQAIYNHPDMSDNLRQALADVLTSAGVEPGGQQSIEPEMT